MKNQALTIAMIIGAVSAVIFSYFQSFSVQCEKIESEVLRLHILANSDSKEDQELKYALRDYLISYSGITLSGAENLEEAKALARESITEIENTAKRFIKSKGYNYDVKAEVKNIYFTTRKYEDFTLPAGNYDALRIIIGEGQGKNWWCVMYPPLCLPACEKKEPYFTPEKSRQIEEGGKIEIRFAVYELMQSVFKN